MSETVHYINMYHIFSDGELIDQPSMSDEPAIMYYVNDGVYGSFNCLLFDHAVVNVSTLKVRHIQKLFTVGKVFLRELTQET